jgi:protein-S-isoprenylcysteine O-methyltransferase Ste14
VGDIFVPKSVSTQTETSLSTALLINSPLLLLWGVQHSVMARSWFKEAIIDVIPQHTERSTYVLLSSVVLGIMMVNWQSIDGLVWQVESAVLVQVIWGLFAFGWILVLFSTFLTDHFDLFGLRQTWLYFVKQTYRAVPFTERFFYRWIRHPMMLGILIAFWATPVMTMSHLVFSIGMTIYVLLGIHFEEKGLARALGNDYVQYQSRTARVIPKIY